MVCSTKFITVNRSMFSCWSLFSAQSVVSLFEMSFDLIAEVSVVIRTVRSAGVSCACFSFFISSCNSFIFCSYLSLFLCLSLLIFLTDYSLVFCVCWLGLVNEVSPVCKACCCGRYCWFYLVPLMVFC